jgi:nickel-dependent lactate racemase
MSIIGTGSVDGKLTQKQVGDIVASAVSGLDVDGKKVLAIIPDATRTCPLPLVARLLRKHLGGRAAKLDFLIALGTHPPMSEERIDALLGIEPGRRAEVLGDSRVFNHLWKEPGALKHIGTIPAARISEISGGLFSMDVDVTVNKMVFDYDLAMVVGPVFPHEVVGFSGGAKYFFPGICGEELLNFFHWLGAVITNPKIIGTKDTPVRATLHAAFDMLDARTCALCMVVKGHDLCGLYFGSVREAWSAAADLSDKVHIIYTDRAYESILSRAPEMYDDLWTGGKCMYKMEPVVADGGELIIYAPHITEISYAHGDVIREIGYHTRDYFLADWDRFSKYPWGIVAHSTHVRGIGRMVDGVERPRVRVTLATGIPEDVCRSVNLGYRDPAGIDVSHWQDAEDEGRLYVPKAGEMLYKLRNPPEWQRA